MTEERPVIYVVIVRPVRKPRIRHGSKDGGYKG